MRITYENFHSFYPTSVTNFFVVLFVWLVGLFGLVFYSLMFRMFTDLTEVNATTAK